MKIVFIHGDDLDKSYNRFSQIIDGVRKKGWKIKEIDYKDDIKNNLINTSLFDEDILYVIKNANKLDKHSLTWLCDNHSKFTSQLLLFSNKKLTATQKKAFPTETKFEEFVRPVILWQFLDSLVPGNAKNSLKLFTKVSETEASELVISLMGNLFRDLYIVLSDGKLSYPDWRAKKIISQARKFTLDEVKGIISELSDIDYKSKTSDTEASLLIELLIAKNLG